MYINKVIFMEWDEVQELENKYGSQIIQQTDYGTNEIVGDTLSNILADIEDYDFTKEELMKDLNNTLGTDVTEMLLNDKLDFILVV